MFDAAKQDNAKYADFAARMLANEASAVAAIARQTKYVSTAADTTAATVRPSR